MGRFKARKSFKFNKSKIICFGIFLFSVALTIKFIDNKNLVNDNSVISFFKNSTKYKFLEPEFLLKYALNIELIHESDNKNEEVVSKNENNTGISLEVKPENVKPLEKIVYIYNTHQEEKYLSNYMEAYNVSATVLIASKILKEYLESEGIGVVVEERNIPNEVRRLNKNYGYSYTVAREFMESKVKEEPTLKYFIDLHRDSSKYENTTTEIDGEKYAKLLFVVGLDHNNFEPNLMLAEKLKAKITSYNEKLFRGIMKKSGKGVNGIYNQDFSPNAFLVEVGGQYNSISEVNNTLKVFAHILAEFIKEDMNE